MSITTNGHQRTSVTFADLPALEQSYWSSLYDGAKEARYVKYRRCWYNLDDCQRLEPKFAPELCQAGWHGYWDETVFSAVLVKYHPDEDTFTLGYYSETGEK